MAHVENRIRGSLFFYMALTCGYLPRFVVCTGFADSKHSVDGSHCDKSQALDKKVYMLLMSRYVSIQ
jgi:hypothetical protein